MYLSPSNQTRLHSTGTSNDPVLRAVQSAHLMLRLGVVFVVVLSVVALGGIDPSGIPHQASADAAPAYDVAGAAQLSVELERDYDAEREFAQLVNAERSRHGLTPLVIHVSLTNGAAEWVSTLNEQEMLAHAPHAAIRESAPDGWVDLGENVGRGHSAQSLMAAFMASPGHRANITNPKYTHLGVAAVRNANDGRVYTTHRFASVPGPPCAPLVDATATRTGETSRLAQPVAASRTVLHQLAPWQFQ